MRWQAITLIVWAGLLAGCDNAQRQPQGAQPLASQESERLNQWFDARFEEQLDFSPTRKTFLGRKDDNDKIDDLSEAAQDVQLDWYRATVQDLRQSFDYALLTPEAKISYDLWIYALEDAERARPFRRRSYIFDQRDGPHTGLPQVLLSFHRVEEAADMDAYNSRIGEIARALDQGVERAKLAVEDGVRPPRFAYAAVLDQARALITGAPFAGDGDAPLWKDANAKVDALVASGKIDSARAEALREGARTALVERFKPAYDELIAFVETDMPNADEIATGVWKLPDGAAFYEQRLVSSTTTQMTAEEIHALGLSEVARIKTEMEAIKAKVGFTGTLQEFFTFIRENPQFYFPSTDEGREAYLQAARDHFAVIESRLPDFFGLLPKAGLVVKRVEAFRELPGAAQHYFPGTPDGSRPGVYYAHLIDMGAMPKPTMEAIAYHEGIPGHHMQVSIAQELTGVPQFRTQSFFTAYTEGWGLYAELLAKEMDGYDDPYADFGRLSTEIWRAIRLVVDTGLHAKRWTEEDAVQYMIANSASAEGQIRAEVRRYIVNPGQATAYKIGMLAIQKLRAHAEATLGEKFDVRGFHDTVLGGGAMPLAMLERRVNDWVAAQ
jgi:uncharacterized protein (DUF885 family)